MFLEFLSISLSFFFFLFHDNIVFSSFYDGKFRISIEVVTVFESLLFDYNLIVIIYR